MGVPIVWDREARGLYYTAIHKAMLHPRKPFAWDTYEDSFGLRPDEIKGKLTEQRIKQIMERIYRSSGKAPTTIYASADWFNLARNDMKPVKKDYRTIGVRFVYGHNAGKIYTYKIRKGAKVHLGQELVAESNPPTGWTKSVVVVVRIDKTPQDDGPYEYKFITQKASDL